MRKIALWCLVTLPAGACCSAGTGPTAPAVAHSVELAPGEVRFFDVDTPEETATIRLTFSIPSTEAPIRLRTIDPGCLPAPGDACQSYSDTTLTPRPAGVTHFGSGVTPGGNRTRLVVENPSTVDSVALSISIEPQRAGCGR